VQLALADGERVVTGKMADDEKEKFLTTLRRLQERRAKTGMVPLGDVLTDPQFAAFCERYADHPASKFRCSRWPKHSATSRKRSWQR
jgi:hypothetical protein